MDKKLKIHHSSFIIRKSRGFTLIELLVAISIIGVLSSFLLANFVGVRQRARDGVRKSDLRQIQSALELYRSDQGNYPNPSIPSCSNPLTVKSVSYIQKIPCDPSSSISYQYNSSSGISYCVRACLENAQDADRDEIKYGSDNPAITGCTLSTCSSGKSYSLQNP